MLCELNERCFEPDSGKRGSLRAVRSLSSMPPKIDKTVIEDLAEDLATKVELREPVNVCIAGEHVLQSKNVWRKGEVAWIEQELWLHHSDLSTL